MNSNHSTNKGLAWSKAGFLFKGFIYSPNVMAGCSAGSASENQALQRVPKL